ncbi:MAG: stage II sporulation protein P [Clostridia bacterium]|nr:stage II sporulation protein P [Clostridia bacterium]
MKSNIMKKVPYILLIVSIYIISVLIPKNNSYFYSTESIFHSKPQKYNLSFPLYAALPFPVKQAPAKKEVIENKPDSNGESPIYHTYNTEPAVVSGKMQIKNSTGYTPDTESLLETPFPLKGEKPKVLILHTHTSEAYAQSSAYSYIPSDAYRTEDPERNICLVGDKLTKTLEKHGILAIHDTTSHDYPSYSGCYGRSLETAQNHLSKDPSIDVIIDLHRDAISDENGNYLKTSTKIDGKDCAQAVIIIGTDAGGLPHPDWEKNLSLGLKMQETMCKLYPSLMRPLQLRTERFNGHASGGALLIEIGSNGNTMEEALYCAELVGNAISETLKSLK